MNEINQEQSQKIVDSLKAGQLSLMLTKANAETIAHALELVSTRDIAEALQDLDRRIEDAKQIGFDEGYDEGCSDSSKCPVCGCDLEQHRQMIEQQRTRQITIAWKHWAEFFPYKPLEKAVYLDAERSKF